MKKGVNVVILSRDGEILVLKRYSAAKFFPNLWNLPGGEVEKRESLQQAAKREVKEETNFVIEPEAGPFSVYYYPDGKKENASTAVYAIKSKLFSGRIGLDDKHTDFKWVSKKSWRSLDYTPSGLDTLKKVFGI